MPNNRPTTADAMGAGRAAGQSGAHHPDFAGGKLWTCGRCFRNNEARLDACHHCRAAAPQVKSDHFSRGPVAHNPFERYIARSGPRAPVASLASTRTPLVNTTTPGWNGDGKELGWDEDVSVVEESEIVSCNGNLIGKRTHGNVPSPDVVMEARGHDSAARNRYTSVDQDLPATETTQNGVSRAPAKCRRISIDPEAAKTWIYPVNYPVREYQLEIVTQALYKNTLVSLPTGLGKTLIAAVVMYNFYRWFPEGKVVFLAPTKPLVAQQISACYDVMGIPERDTAELQGSVTPEARRRLWDERRVFYCTPQSMVNDIKQRRCDPGKFVCVVVDEAHRATGNYAYVNVIREVAAVTPFFRVLALSATPGSDIKTIQQVLLNLRISHIECRSEDDPEVARHTHARQVEIVKCRLGSHIDAIRQGLVAVLQPLVSRMVSKNVLYTPDPMALKAWTVIQCLHKFRRVAHEGGRAHMAGEVEAEMGVLTKVVQAKDTLVTHGASGCLQKLVGMEFDVSKRGFRSNAERRLMQHPEWAGLMKLLRQTAENSAGVSTKHPKLIKLKGILLEHFSRHQGAGRSTRAIVFTHLRDSVEEITDFLAGEELLRVKAFIGQGNSTTAKARAAALASAGIGVTGKDGEGDWEVAEMLPPKQRLKGQTQKEQKAVVKAFFAGEFNCLVATCIAEEGLDIGEVDLIVSFDALNSPVRMVQRMGRTGRKRAGKVVVLVTEGAEESKLRNSNSKSKSIMRALQARKDKFELFQGDDPMVPPGPRPFMVKKEMVIVEYHLSQVGGHQRKASRRGGSGGVGGCSRSGGGASDGGGGNGTNGGTDGSGAKEDWRLTPAQNAVLAEAYSEEPGMKRYIPDPASGWRRQKSPWSTGRVQRSVRSRLLCEMKAFVAHEEWEILYDPASMELALDSHWRRADDEEKIPPAAAKLKAKVGPGNRSGVDGGHGDGGLTANRRRFPVEIGDSDDERTLEASLKTNDEVWRKHDGDSVGRCRTEAGDERDVEKPVASSRGRERRDTKPGERCRREDGCESSSNGSGTKRKFKPGGEDGGEVVVLKDGSDLYEVTEKGADDGGKGSVGGATPTSPRAPGATPPGKVARLKKKNGGACDGKGSDEAGELDGLARSFGAGDTCSQLEDRSRRPPVRDGVAEIVDARPHGATAPGSPSPGGPDSGDRRNGNANCGNMPYAQLSASVTGKSSCLAASEVGERVRRRLSADPLSASSESSRPDVDFTAPSGPSSAGDDATGCSSEASKGCGASFEGGVEVLQRKMEGRWECGCGCRMQASAKRCAMCGGRRPQGYSSSPTSTSGGSGSESAVGGVTEGVRSSEVGNDQKAFPVGVDRVGDGLLERCRKPRCTSTSVTTRILVAPDSGVGASAVAAEGRWRCSCGSEYAASRTKCRACGAPRPKARSSGGITADAVPREGSTREDRSKECRGNGGDEVNAKGCSIAGTDAPSCGSGVGVVIQGTKSASHAEPAKWPLKTRDFCAGVDNPPADCDRPACGTGNGTSERDESAFPKGSPGTKSNRHGRGKPDDRLVGVSAGKANSPVTGARKGEIEMCTHEGSANANDDSEDSTLAEIFPSLHRFRAEESSGDGVGGGVKGSTHSAGGVPSICSRVKPMSLLRAPLIDSPPTFGSGRDAAHAHKADDLGRGSSRFTAVSPPQAPRMTSPSFGVEAPSCPSKRTNPERTSARSESSSEDGRKSLIPPPPRLAAASGRAVSNGYTPGGEVSTPGQSCAAGDPTDIASIGATSGDVSLTKQALLGTPSRGLNKSKGVAALEGGGVERIDEKGAGDDTEEAWRGSPEELDAQSPSSVLSCRSTETVKEEIDSILLPVEVSACAGDSSRFAATKLLVSARGISAVSSANGDGDLREARGVPDFGESRRDVVADADSSREGAHKYVNIQQLAGEVGDEEPLLSFHMDTNPGLRDESERDEELAGASHVFVDRSSCGAAHGVETDDREVQVVGGLASDESVGPEQQGVRDGGVSAAKRRKGIGGSVSAEISGGGGSSPVGSERRYNGSGPQSPSNCSLDVHEEDENEDGDEEEDHGDDGDDDDDVPCGVCGDRTSKDDDPIVLCDGKGCRVAVHPDCYGIEKIPVGSWFCDPCAASSSSFSSACTTATVEGEHIARKEKRRISPGGSSPTSPPACVLCGQTGGALKISRCMQWAHVVCVWWTPELATEPGTVRPRLLSALDPERASLTCSVCHELGGSAVQCAVDSCMEAYHPFCAMGAKVLMREINGIFELFCRTHSKLERAKAKEGGRREVGAAVGRVGDAAVSREREEENAVLGEDTVFADQNDRHLQRSGEAVRSAPDGWSKDFVADGGSSVRHPRRDRATASGSGRMKDVGDSPDVDCPSSAGARATHSILRGRRAIVLDSRTGDSGDESRVAETVEKKTNFEDLGGVDERREELDEGVSSQEAQAVGGRDDGGKERGRDAGTPHKIFDMAPPPTPHRRPPSRSGRTEGDEHRGEQHQERGKTAAEGVDRIENLQKDSTLVSTPSRRISRSVGDGVGSTGRGRVSALVGGDDLVTLSQAVSPEDAGRLKKEDPSKRRRLMKCATADDATNRRAESKASKRSLSRNSGEEVDSSRRLADQASDDDFEQARVKTKGSKRRSYNYERTSYRRFIEVEADVDSGVSDDDEVELDTYYDSQDSFVNDGPISYETSSSQEDGAPGSLRGSQEGANGLKGSELDEDGEGDDLQGKRGKRQEGGKRRIGDGDEKGMYLQLLARTQSPPKRGNHLGLGRVGKRTLDARGGSHQGEGGRFAFVNAVMRHARDGGDPMDIEDACASDTGYASTDQTPASKTETERDSVSGLPTTESRGTISAKKSVRECASDAEAMYSQALLQAHPGSPMSPTLSAISPVSRRTGVINAGRVEKENCRPSGGLEAKRSGKGGLAEDVGQVTKGRMDVDSEGKAQGKQEPTPKQDGRRATAVQDNGRPTEVSIVPPREKVCSTNSRYSEAKGVTGLPGNNLDCLRSVSSGSESGGATGTAARCDPPQPQGAGKGAGGCGKGVGLTEQQRQQMLENREKALARLRQKQAAKGIAVRAGALPVPAARSAPELPSRGADVSGEGAGASAAGGVISYAGRQLPSKFGTESSVGGSRAPESGMGSSSGSAISRMRPSLDATAGERGMAVAPQVKPRLGLRRSRLSLGQNKVNSKGMNQPVCSEGEKLSQGHNGRRTGESASSGTVGFGCKDVNGRSQESKGHASLAPAPSGRFSQMQGATPQRERFRMTMTMDEDSDEDSDYVSSATGKGTAAEAKVVAHRDDSHQKSHRSVAGGTSVETKAATTTEAVSCRKRGGLSRASTGTSRSSSNSISPTPALPGLPQGRAVATVHSSRQTTAPSEAEAKERVGVTTVPLSAPRAAALEVLALELRSRPGIIVHACPLGGGLRDVDIVVGSQCAVCVRTRRQVLSQTHSASSPSRSPPSTPPCSELLSQGIPPLVALLENSVRRYTRMVLLVVRGLEGAERDAMDGGEEERDAVSKVEAVRGVSVLSSRGWKQAADRILELVDREERADVGLPREVTGPGLSAAQAKFMTFLLKAPTLSYSGGLFLLKAFRGRSVKDVIASSAKEFQASVPGMSAQQAAKLKRFLVSSGASPLNRNKSAPVRGNAR